MNHDNWTSSTVTSADGTTIAYETLGTGAGLIVVGGVLSTARNYMDLGRELAGSFTVHLMERRGRGASGPQGPGYSIEKECEDLLAVRAETGADRVFGHSYGGLVALQTARHAAVFRQVAVYEPAVVLDGAPAPAWLDPYRELLAHGDTRGAFATMVKHAGFAPRALAAMPLAVVRLVLRAGIRGHEWQRTEALLEANLAEQQAQLDVAGIAGYAEIASPTLLIGGSDSPPSVTHSWRRCGTPSPPRPSRSSMGSTIPLPRPTPHRWRIASSGSSPTRPAKGARCRRCLMPSRSRDDTPRKRSSTRSTCTPRRGSRIGVVGPSESRAGALAGWSRASPNSRARRGPRGRCSYATIPSVGRTARPSHRARRSGRYGRTARLRVFSCNNGPDDWSPFTISDVRQERFEEVAAKRHWPVLIERVEVCEHGALEVGSDRGAFQLGRGHELAAVAYELRFVRADGHQTMVVQLEADDRVIAMWPAPVVIVSQPVWMNISTSFSNQTPVLHRIPASRSRSPTPRYRAAGVGSSTAQRGPAIGILRGRIVGAAATALASAIGASASGSGRSYG